MSGVRFIGFYMYGLLHTGENLLHSLALEHIQLVIYAALGKQLIGCAFLRDLPVFDGEQIVAVL